LLSLLSAFRGLRKAPECFTQEPFSIFDYYGYFKLHLRRVKKRKFRLVMLGVRCFES
jgi:hypothetical protein